MQKSYFLPLSQIGQWSKTEIGSLSYHLGKLVDVQVKVAPGFVVPKATLLQICQDNHLAFSVQQWLTHQTHPIQAKTAKSLSAIFSQVQIAAPISRQYLDTFYQTIQGKEVSVVASWLTAAHEHLSEISPPIQGDANVFQALLETWAKTLEATLNPETLVDDESLVPAAFLIQSYLKAELTGFVHTLNSQKSVYQVTVDLPKKLHKTQGQATFFVDVRTWQIIKSELPPDLRLSQLEKLIKPEHILNLAQLAYRIKLHDLHQLQISWEMAEHEIYVSNVERIADWEELKHHGSTQSSQLLLVGSAAIAGEATALAVVVTGELAEKRTFDQQILITPHLDHVSLRNVIGLKGVITEQPLSWQAHQLLNHYHIPAIARVTAATKKVKTGQSIAMNGYTGRVHAGTQITSAPALADPIIASPHQVMAVTNQAWDHQEYPTLSAHGIIYQSSQRWLETGIHPLELLRSGQQQTLKNQIISDLTSYRDLKGPLVYELPSLRSDQLFKLKQGKYFETKEANPELGFSGTTRLLRQSEWLDFELEVITQAYSLLPNQLRILLPSTRDPQEFSSLTGKLKMVIPSQVWLPITYPATLLELKQYLLNECEFVVLQSQKLLALSQGLDPDYSDLLALYPLNITLLKTILQLVLPEIKAQQTLLEVSNNFQALSELVVELGLGGVVTPLSDAQTAQHLLGVAHHQVMQES